MLLKGAVRQYGNHKCSEQDPLSLFKGLQMGIIGFSQKETGAKSVAMVTIPKVSFCFFFMFCKFEEHCSHQYFQRYS